MPKSAPRRLEDQQQHPPVSGDGKGTGLPPKEGSGKPPKAPKSPKTDPPKKKKLPPGVKPIEWIDAGYT